LTGEPAWKPTSFTSQSLTSEELTGMLIVAVWAGIVTAVPPIVSLMLRSSTFTVRTGIG
jgi:hypothetical protein